MLWSFWGSIVFAGVGILSDIIQNEPFTLNLLNNVLVILWSGVVITNAILPGPKKNRESKIILAGFFVFGLFALNANLVGLNILPWEWSREENRFSRLSRRLGLCGGQSFFRQRGQAAEPGA